MTLLVVETSNFTIGAPVTPVLRRNFMRADVPPAPTTGTTVVFFIPPEDTTFHIPADPKPFVVPR